MGDRRQARTRLELGGDRSLLERGLLQGQGRKFLQGQLEGEGLQRRRN